MTPTHGSDRSMISPSALLLHELLSLFLGERAERYRIRCFPLGAGRRPWKFVLMHDAGTKHIEGDDVNLPVPALLTKPFVVYFKNSATRTSLPAALTPAFSFFYPDLCYLVLSPPHKPSIVLPAFVRIGQRLVGGISRGGPIRKQTVRGLYVINTCPQRDTQNLI